MDSGQSDNKLSHVVGDNELVDCQQLQLGILALHHVDSVFQAFIGSIIQLLREAARIRPHRQQEVQNVCNDKRSRLTKRSPRN